MDFPIIDGISFRMIPGFDCYAVADNGTVWSNTTRVGARPRGWYPVKSYRRPYGARYVVVCLRGDNGKGKVLCRYVHRLVLESFVGPCPDGMECCHSDSDTKNNSLTNLRWDTRIENCQDRIKSGRQLRGSSNKNAKLTEADVLEIRRLKDEGWKQTEIGKKFGVEQTVISSVVRGATWAHVKEHEDTLTCCPFCHRDL